VILEELWILKRQRAFPGRKLLRQATIDGVKSTAGKLTKTADIGGQGRILDFAEMDGSKVLAILGS
jgi:hypothetical protein